MKIKEYAESRGLNKDNVRQIVYRMGKDPKWVPFVVSGGQGPNEGYELAPEAVRELDRRCLQSVKLSAEEYNALTSELDKLRDENERLKEDLLAEKSKSIWKRIFG